MNTNEKFEQFARHVERTVVACEGSIANFATKLVADPAHALSWGTAVFDEAAKLQVYKICAHAVQAARDGVVEPEKVVGLLVADFTRDALRAAQYPARSTSPTSNLMEQSIASAKARFIDDQRFA